MATTSCTPNPRKNYNKKFKRRVVEYYKELSLGNAKNRIIETAKCIILKLTTAMCGDGLLGQK